MAEWGIFTRRQFVEVIFLPFIIRSRDRHLTFVPPGVIDRRVSSHGVEPSPEVGVWEGSVGPREQLNEGVLRDVGGVIRVSGEAYKEVV